MNFNQIEKFFKDNQGKLIFCNKDIEAVCVGPTAVPAAVSVGYLFGVNGINLFKIPKGTEFTLFRIETTFFEVVDKNGIHFLCIGGDDFEAVSQTVPQIDLSRYPKICGKCGAPAYEGAFEVDCSAKCDKK